MRVEIGRRALTPSVLLLVVFAAHAGPTGLDAGTAPASPPVARTVNVEETLFGTKLSDPYRWMEGNDNREFDEWLRAQGAHARRYLDALPGRRPLLERIRDLGLHTSAISDLQIAGGR